MAVTTKVKNISIMTKGVKLVAIGESIVSVTGNYNNNRATMITNSITRHCSMMIDSCVLPSMFCPLCSGLVIPVCIPGTPRYLVLSSVEIPLTVPPSSTHCIYSFSSQTQLPYNPCYLYFDKAMQHRLTK